MFVLEKLSSEALQEILLRAVRSMGLSVIDNDSEEQLCSGDASGELDRFVDLCADVSQGKLVLLARIL